MWWLLVPSILGAPADNIELSWDAPTTCPSREAIRAETDRLLAGATVTGTVRTTASVNELDGAWEASFTMESDGGRTERTLVGKRCDTVAHAIALEMALVLNVDRVLEALASAPATDPQPTAEPTVAADVATTEPAPPRPRRARAHAGLRATGGVAIGQTATVAGGVGIACAAVFRSFRVEAHGWALMPSVQQVPGSSGTVATMLGSAGLRACPVPRLGSLEMPLCVGFEGGAVRAAASGLPRSKVVHEPWAGFVVAPALSTQISGGLHLWVEGAAVLNLVRPGFHVEGTDSEYRMPMGAARVVAGLELRLEGR